MAFGVGSGLVITCLFGFPLDEETQSAAMLSLFTPLSIKRQVRDQRGMYEIVLSSISRSSLLLLPHYGDIVGSNPAGISVPYTSCPVVLRGDLPTALQLLHRVIQEEVNQYGIDSCIRVRL
jgi:hypothetical protein